MNAAVVHTLGSPPRYEQFDDPVARESELVVDVRAAGLHRVVRAIASGAHYLSTTQLPFVPGIDGTGRLADGSRVYFAVARSPFGSFAERSLTKRDLCVPAPESLDDVTVAAIANPAMSSWAALTLRALLVAGESVLVLGATGVAGELAVQVAKRLGARRVVAAGRSRERLEELQSLGADATIALGGDREALVAAFQNEIAQSGVDVVLDYLWGEPAEIVLEALAGKGLDNARRVRFVHVGSQAGQTITLPGATLRSSAVEIMGSGFGSVPLEKIMQSLAQFLAEAGSRPFRMQTRAVPLGEVEAQWGAEAQYTRTVFVP